MKSKNFVFFEKVICVVLAICLALMMIPASLFKNKAYADSVSPSQSTFGQFVYDAKSNSNQVIYSEEEILQKLGMKEENATTIQKNAEDQVKVELVKKKHSIATENMPTAETGAAVTLTSIDSITSSLACLSAQKLPQTTNWQFSVGDPQTASATSVLSIAAKYATWKADYKCTLNGEAITAKTEIPLDNDACVGKIVLTPTTEVAANKAAISLVTIDLQLKSLAKTLNTYNATITKTNAEGANTPQAAAENIGKTSDTTTSDGNGTIFKETAVILKSSLIFSTKNFNKEDLFVESINPENYTFTLTGSKNYSNYVNCTYPTSESSWGLILDFVKVYRGDPPITITLNAKKKDTPSVTEDFKITIKEIASSFLKLDDVEATVGDSKPYTDADLFKETVKSSELELTVVSDSDKVTAKVQSDKGVRSVVLSFVHFIDPDEYKPRITITAKKDSVTDSVSFNVIKVGSGTIKINLKSDVFNDGNLEARDSIKQEENVAKKLSDYSAAAESKVPSGYKIALKTDKHLWDETSYVIPWDNNPESLQTITVIKENLEMQISDGSATQDYKLELSDTTLTINNPDSYSGEMYFEGDKEVKNVSEYWFTKNEENVKVTSSDKGKNIAEKPNPSTHSLTYSNQIYPITVSAIPSTEHPVQAYVKTSDDGILKKIDKKIKYDNLAPKYSSFKIQNSDKEDPVPEDDNFIKGIIDNIKFFFTPGSESDKHSVKVDFTFENDDRVAKINSVKVKVADDKEINAEKKIEQSDEVWTITLDTLNYKGDIKNWRITSTKENSLSESEAEVTTESYEVLSNRENKAECTTKWSNNDEKFINLDPNEYSSTSQKLRIVLNDPDYKYNQSFMESATSKKYNKDIVKVVAYTKNTQSGELKEDNTLSKTYSMKQFKPSENPDEYVLDVPCNKVEGQYVKYEVTRLSTYVDVFNRPANDLDKKDEKGNDRTFSWSFSVDDLAPEVCKVDWTTIDEPATLTHEGYYNKVRKATVHVLKTNKLNDVEAKDFNNIFNLNLDTTTLNGQVVSSILNYGEWAKGTDLHEYAVELKFAGENIDEFQGRWKYYVAGIDKIRNKSDIVFKDDVSDNYTFVQDWTNPELNITLSNDWSPATPNNVYDNVSYFNVDSRTLTTEFTEQYSWSLSQFDEGYKGNDACPDIKVEKTKEGWSDDYNYQFTSWLRTDNESKGEVVCKSKDGHFQFNIKGTDLAGNELIVKVKNEEKTETTTSSSFDSGKFALDKTPPTLSVSWNRYDAANERYYNGPRTATVTIKERNFCPKKAYVNLIYKLTDDFGGATSTDVNPEAWTPGDDFTHSVIINFPSEGDIDFTVNGRDLATNGISNPYRTSFTQDWTAPTMSVNWDNNNVVNGKYYTAARTATVAIEEHNWNDSFFHVNPIVTPGNDGTLGSSGISWNHNGNMHIATVSFPMQGTYSMTVDGQDLALNLLSPYAQNEFIVDWTQPQIQISGVDNRQAYKDSAVPSVTVTDTNVSAATTCSVAGLANNKAQPYNASPNVGSAQATYSFSDPEKVPDNDGVYRVEVNAVDMAGNTSTQSLVWSVNRFGSTYVIDADTETMIDGYVNDSKKKDVVVTEINPSGLKSSSVEVAKGSFVNKLEEGKDYTTEASGGGDSWFECTYKIPKDKFTEDANYTVNFNSEDSAGNISENTGDYSNTQRNGKVNIKFMVDNTKPSNYINNLSENSYDEIEHNASVTLEDNSKNFQEAKIVIDGDEHWISGDNLKNDKYNVDFTVKEADHAQTIEVMATDKAGNEMDTTHRSIVVSTNPFVRFINNIPLVIGTCIAVVVIVGGIATIVILRRKNKSVKNG